MTTFDGAGTIDEYHARQRANMAENEASLAKNVLGKARIKARRVRKRLEKALELLDGSVDSAARSEIQAAIHELERL